MELSESEKLIQSEALDFARTNKKDIAKRLTNKARFLPEDEPVSVFMAGSPGAGKTEASIELLSIVEDNGVEILRIDPDELRHEFPTYTGDNSWLFQGAVSILVERIHDLALKQRQSFLLVGTLSHYDKAEQNITRSLRKRRVVQILYVYQDPALAWEFVKSREAVEGRHIKRETFIDQYFAARNVVNRLKTTFGSGIRVDLLLKNTDNSHKLYKAGIDKIDNHVPEKYTPADLAKMLGLP